MTHTNEDKHSCQVCAKPQLTTSGTVFWSSEQILGQKFPLKAQKFPLGKSNSSNTMFHYTIQWEFFILNGIFKNFFNFLMLKFF